MSFFSRLSDGILGVFGKDTKELETVEVVKQIEEIKVVQEETVKIKRVEELKDEVETLNEIDILKTELSTAFNNLSSMDEYWDAIVAIEAVATSMASSDKDFSDAERKEIKLFIQKINPNKDIPSAIKEKIDAIYANPLPLNKAFLLAKETKIEMSVYEEIIETVMHTDGVKFEEKVVLNAWHDFKQYTQKKL